MKTFTKAILAASAVILSPVAVSTLAQAQSVAYSDYEAMIGLSGAYKTADAQIKATYKAQSDAIDSRAKVLDAELNVMRVRLQADYKANPNNPALQAQAQAIRQKEEAGKAEIQNMSVPILRAYAYVEEQISAKLDVAVRQAMAKKRVALLVKRDVVLQDTPGMNLTPDIVAELNTLVPQVSINVPATWQPGGQSQAASPSVAPAAPTPSVAPPKPKPTGR
jgi:Skp family chaperone for outer membrane proteins